MESVTGDRRNSASKTPTVLSRVGGGGGGGGEARAVFGIRPGNAMRNHRSPEGDSQIIDTYHFHGSYADRLRQSLNSRFLDFL